MMQDQDSAAQREASPASDTASPAPDDNSPERFLSRFGRVPSGLDPSQVYNHFITSMSRIKQLEEQASRISAPFLIERALRDAAEIRTQASQSAERAYNAIVKGAEEEAERLQAQARESADASVEQTRATVGEAQREADQILARARAEADEIRQQAQTALVETEQELERLVAGFLQRLLDRREARAATEAPTGTSAPGASPGTDPTSADELTARESIPFTSSPTSTAGTDGPVSSDQPSPVAMPTASVVDNPQTAQPGPRPFLAAALERAADRNATEPPTDLSHQDQPATSPDQPTPLPAEKKSSSGFKLPSWLDL
jgi:F0F1-type ATP synthase membrane subunit b/b'